MNIIEFIIGTICGIVHYLYVDSQHSQVIRVVSCILAGIWLISRLWVWIHSFKETRLGVGFGKGLLDKYEGRRVFDRISLKNVRLAILRKKGLFLIPLGVMTAIVIIYMLFSMIDMVVGNRFTEAIIFRMDAFRDFAGPTLLLVCAGSLLFLLANIITFTLSPVVLSVTLYVGLHIAYGIAWEDLSAFAVIACITAIPLTLVILFRVGIGIARMIRWLILAIQYRFQHYTLILLRYRTSSMRW